MKRGPAAASATLLLLLATGAPAAPATFTLPPSCAVDPAQPDTTTPIAELRRQLEEGAQSDPDAAIRMMCATIPRVARETGEDSVETAWWVGSLATPLIAYRQAFDEALPLLDFARGVFERRIGPEAVELADLHVAMAWIRFRQGRLQESVDAWKAVLRVREAHPGAKKVELQKALVGLALAQVAQRDFAAGRISLGRARAILEENGETISEAAAAVENAFTNLAWREENYADARRHAETQLAIETKLGGKAPQLVPAYALLGQILERLDEYEASERALREALRLAESDEGPLQRHLLSALTTLGGYLDDRGRPEEALALDERALALGTATLGADAPRLVGLLVNLADAHRALGRLPDARRDYERAGGIVAGSATDVERSILVRYLLGLGTLQQALGEPDEARASLRRGLEAAGDDPTLSIERAEALTALAGNTGDPAEAERLLRQALTLLRSKLPESHPAILRVINLLCGLEVEAPQAPDCDEAARRIDAGGNQDPGLRAAVHGNLSDRAQARGDALEAERLAVRAVAAAAALGTPDPAWRTQIRLARLLAPRDRPVAIFFGKQSLKEIERLRGSFKGDDRRFDRPFLEDKVAVYRAVADWLLEAGRIDEGVEVLRLLKGEELYDFVLRAAAPADREGPGLTGEERDFEARYAGALASDAAAGEEISRLLRLQQAGRLSVQERRDLEARLSGQAEAEASRAGRLSELLAARAARPEAPAARRVETATLEQEARACGPDCAIATYLLTDTHLRVLIATRLGAEEIRVPVDTGRLQRRIGDLLDAMSRRADVSAAARDLYDTVAAPVDAAAKRAGVKRLVLWPDGALRYVPFAALSDGQRWLGEKYAIELRAGAGGPGPLPASGDASRPASPPAATAEAARRAWTVRGLGVTRAIAGFEALPAVGEELCSVVNGPIDGLETSAAACRTPGRGSGALQGAGYADAAFTRDRFEGLFRGARDFSVLHLGTHFSLRPGNVLRSSLLLGDGSRFTLDALGALDLGGLDLVTLSACQTGVGGAVTEDGREVEGLSALLARRGARRVVASLWEVEDQSTALLMRTLYRSLRSDPSPARALQKAQDAVRTLTRDGTPPYAHPYYWAGFTVSAP